jgi:hypothetical protein
MPGRKFADLAHLSPEEYRKESMKRRDSLRKAYRQSMYIDRVASAIPLEDQKKKLEAKLAIINAKLEGLSVGKK